MVYDTISMTLASPLTYLNQYEIEEEISMFLYLKPNGTSIRSDMRKSFILLPLTNVKMMLFCVYRGSSERSTKWRSPATETGDR